MKLTIALLTALTLIAAPAFAGGEMKEVCKEVTAKDGTKKQQCKKIKVHKKLEGTAVPEKAPAAPKAAASKAAPTKAAAPAAAAPAAPASAPAKK